MIGHGDDPAPALEALTDSDPELRRAALGAAWRLGAIDGPQLSEFFTDPVPAVARRAIELAARVSPEDQHVTVVARRLVAALGGDHAEGAAFALGELAVAEDGVVEALVAQAREAADALERESAVAALGVLGEGEETVLAALSDIATVRRRAVIALANFEGPAVEAALTTALDDRDWQVRQAAEDLLTPPDLARTDPPGPD
ncbi:MAG: hypothetical protein AAF962_05905 [Actinomycetota bacterium]